MILAVIRIRVKSGDFANTSVYVVSVGVNIYALNNAANTANRKLK